MWPFRPHAHRWVSIPTIVQQGTCRGMEVVWMRDRYGKLFDLLMFATEDEVEVYVPYRHRRARVDVS